MLLKKKSGVPQEGEFIELFGPSYAELKRNVATISLSNETKLESISNGRNQERQQNDEEQEHFLKVKVLLQNLNNTVSQRKKRLDAIDCVCAVLDHDISSRHDIELQLGAANVLFQKLVYVMALSQMSVFEPVEKEDPTFLGSLVDDEAEEEVAMLCCALSMVYRANSENLQQSINDIGPSMLPILDYLLDKKVNVLMKPTIKLGSQSPIRAQGSVQSNDLKLPKSEISKFMIVQSITKLLSAFARSGGTNSRQRIIQQKNVLPSMIRIISWRRHNDALHYDFVCEIVAEVFATLGYLAEENEDNQSPAIMLLLDCKGLFDSVLSAAAKDKSSRIRTQASFAMMNLANVPKNRFTDTQQNELLYTLLALMDDTRKGPKKYAGATLFNLAYSQEYGEKLLTHQKGAFLTALERILATDKDKKARSNSAWVIFYLAKGNESVAKRIAARGNLIDCLAKIVKEDDSLVKVPAAKVLRRLSEVVDRNTNCHDILMKALMKAAAR